MRRLVLLLFLVLIACQKVPVPVVKENVSSDKTAKFNVTETSVHPCAVLGSDVGERLCGFGAQRSDQPERGSCFQIFQERRIPMSFVVVEIKLPEDSVEQAKKKLEFDLLTKHGNKSAVHDDLFYYEYDSVNQSRVEFRVKDRIIRVSEIPKNTCKNFSAFVDEVYKKSHEHFN
jgi:hypothetical protein